MTEECSAWNPGLESDIPPAYRKLETIYCQKNVTTQKAEVDENAAKSGLNPNELALFRPERLVLHELIIRVTADILVQEGDDPAELGRNFRRIARHILGHHIQPRMSEITRLWEELRASVLQRVREELDETLFAVNKPEPEPAPKKFLLFARRQKQKTPNTQPATTHEREARAISTFAEKRLNSKDPLSRAIYWSLHRVLGGIAGNQGYLGPDPAFLANLVCNHVCNHHGSALIGEALAPWIAEAIEKEGYETVPTADKPLLISLKGASAAGKSSLRPMLMQIMSDQGMAAVGYATVSPDVWRRLLLDYDALGEAYKYAGRLTGQEVLLIDSKLDHYFRNKAKRQGSISHMLVDRFRFDSFSTERITKILRDTYAQHVDTVYMYFVVTPPHATVDRGWERGLATGRYKAVEDYLDHSVEASAGMPKILFRWLANDKPLFKYRFLDNSVPKGTFPKTIAFGTQKEINIIDCSGFIDIERYKKINIRAKTPQDVYPNGPVLAVKNNLGFLKQCIERIPRVNFIDQASGTAYLNVRNGKFTVLDPNILADQLNDAEQAQILAELAPDLIRETEPGTQE